MKKIYSICLLALICAHYNAFGQSAADTMHFWKKSALTEINFNQANLTNWQGGGQNTIAVAGFLHFTADYKRNEHSWCSKLDAAYGVVKLGGKDVPFLKSDDELKISSNYRRTLREDLSFSVSGDFKTTFAPGYKYGKDSVGNPVRQEKLSEFMSPGYLIMGTGLEFKPKGDIFFAIFSPIATRITIITNDSMAAVGMYGVPAGQHVRVEFGEDLKVGLKWPIMQNVLLESGIELFGNYKHVQQQVVDWSNDLSFKVNSIFTAKIGTRLIYDQDIAVKRDNGSVGPAVQFKEVIALGIQYKLY